LRSPLARELCNHPATRATDDGTESFVTIDLTAIGFEFVVGQKGEQRTLTNWDGQHDFEYVAVR
jgi:hypothetical protein